MTLTQVLMSSLRKITPIKVAPMMKTKRLRTKNQGLKFLRKSKMISRYLQKRFMTWPSSLLRFLIKEPMPLKMNIFTKLFLQGQGIMAHHPTKLKTPVSLMTSTNMQRTWLRTVPVIKQLSRPWFFLAWLNIWLITNPCIRLICLRSWKTKSK